MCVNIGAGNRYIVVALLTIKLTSSCSGFDVNENRDPLYFGLSKSPEETVKGFEQTYK